MYNKLQRAVMFIIGDGKQPNFLGRDMLHVIKINYSNYICKSQIYNVHYNYTIKYYSVVKMWKLTSNFPNRKSFWLSISHNHVSYESHAVESGFIAQIKQITTF